MSADETMIYDFCTELLATKQVSDKSFAAVREHFGERGAIPKDAMPLGPVEK